MRHDMTGRSSHAPEGAAIACRKEARCDGRSGTEATPGAARFLRFGATAVALCLLTATASFAQDAERGRQAFRVCQPCHVPDADTNKLGPHLRGVFGRPAASVEGFGYSPAMRDAAAAGLVWDEAALSEFLSSPKRKVPGTTMRFWGFWSQSQIDDIIAYLRSNP